MRSAQWQVVFFSEHEKIWHSLPWVRTLRRSLIATLQSVSERNHLITVYDNHFKAFWESDWAAYLRNERPAFLLTTDLPHEPADPNSPLTGEWRATARALLRAQVVHTLCNTTRVASLPELEFKDYRLNSFLTIARVAWQTACHEGALQTQTAVTDANDVITALYMPNPPAASFLSTYAQQKLSTLASISSSSGLTPSAVTNTRGLTSNGDHGDLLNGLGSYALRWRFYRTAESCASVIQCDDGSGTLRQAAKVIAIAEACLASLPLSSRAQQLYENQESLVSRHQTADLMRALPRALAIFTEAFDAHAQAQELPSIGNDAGSVVDFVDSRLVYSVAAALLEGSPVEMPNDGTTRAKSLWSECSLLSGVEDELIPIVHGAQQKSEIPIEKGSDEGGVDDVALLPFQENELVDSFLPKEEKGAFKESSLSELAALRRESEQVQEIYQWQRPEQLEPAFWEDAKDIAAGKATFYKSKPLHELAYSEKLGKGQRRRVRSTLARAEGMREQKRKEELALLRKQVNRWIDEKEQRNIQQSAKFNQWYAQSLVGTKYSRKVAAADSEDDKKLKGKQQHHAKGQKKGQSKKEQIIREQEEKRQEEEMEKQRERWATLEKRLDAATKESEWSDSAANEVKRFMQSCSNAPEIVMDAVQFLIDKSYAQHKNFDAVRKQALKEKQLPPEHSMRMAVHIWEGAMYLLEHHVDALVSREKGKKVGKSVCKTLEKLGFAQASLNYQKRLDEEAERQASNAGEKLKKGKDKGKGKETKNDSKGEQPQEKEPRVTRDPDKRANCHMSAARFEMIYAGHRLPRPGPPDRDPRAESFNPDYWQRTVLDCIDHGSSAVICAPTSSGKTFISSYVMESVLRSSSDGRVVFLAPTKALVNQVAAQVYKDFGNVYGIFTRDYRHNALESRVLVTVPSCLEVLLMSPQYQEWAKTLQFVIFDEIHCIGDEEGGEVWEHLLLMLRCPFLALSATVGNPEEFANWLKSAKQLQYEQDKRAGCAAKPHKYEVSLVVHKERHADLRSHVFIPDQKNMIDLSDGVLVNRRGIADEHLEEARKHANSHVEELHPASALSSYVLRTHGFPSELSFEPRDTLTLFDKMMEKAGGMDEALCQLKPEWRFKNDVRIARPRAREFELSLQDILVRWAKGSEKQQQWLEAVLTDLQQGLTTATQTAETELGTSIEYGEGEAIGGPFLDLLVSLGASDRLPALVFNFDRFVCVELVEQTVLRLERLEAQYEREHAREIEAKQRAIERAQKQAQKEQERKKKDEDTMPEEQPQMMQEEEGPVNKLFTFVKEGEQMVKQELDALLKTLKLDEKDILVRALHRGIGIHHPGLSKKYRSAVEILFRAKHLKVVIATSTMAYGINMPCRSVVFAGDSIFFDALHFRQMSGRAGRRGFDDLGHIVFFGIPGYKISRLLVSPVPYLRGRQPVSITLVLRLLMLHEQYPAARDTLLCLLQVPHLAQEQPHLVRQIQHLFRHSLEYLQRRHLIDAGGESINLGPLAAHVFWTEPANLALTHMLEQGVFHQATDPSVTADGEKLVKERHRQWQSISHDLLLALSHLFQREAIRPNVLEDKRLVEGGICPSKVVLEDPPGPCKDALDQHNKSTMETMTSFVRLFAHNERLPEGTTLPLSQLDFSTKNSKSDSGSTVDLGSFLDAMALHYEAVSPFAALSGKGDKFESAQELCWFVRDGISMEVAYVPVLSARDRHGRRMPLNRHVLDYIKHGQKGLLTTANGIPEGVAWEALHEFVNSIKAVSGGLGAVAPSEGSKGEDDEFISGSQLLASFKRLSADYQAAHDSFNE